MDCGLNVHHMKPCREVVVQKLSKAIMERAHIFMQQDAALDKDGDRMRPFARYGVRCLSGCDDVATTLRWKCPWHLDLTKSSLPLANSPEYVAGI